MSSTQERLLEELQFLGIDEATVELLALLPLVQVAWADGTVQDQERELILDLASTRYHLTEDARHMLDSWLKHPPSERYLARGRKALLALAQENADFSLDTAALDDVVDFSKQVAKAAGGFMGFRSIGADEALVLEDIAEALSVLKRHTRIEIRTDSKFAISVCTQWRFGWRRRGWRKADGEEPVNLDVIQRLDALLDRNDVVFSWVPGHTGEPGNERADALCNEAIDAVLAGREPDGSERIEAPPFAIERVEDTSGERGAR